MLESDRQRLGAGLGAVARRQAWRSIRITTRRGLGWRLVALFRCPGQHNPDSADIVSKGKDKTEGTADDIKSWEL